MWRIIIIVMMIAAKLTARTATEYGSMDDGMLDFYKAEKARSFECQYSGNNNVGHLTRGQDKQLTKLAHITR